MDRSPAEPRPLIAARATGEGAGAIGIVRLSGSGALVTARRFLQGLPAQLPPRRLTRATVVDAQGEPLDDVLVALFPEGQSFTGDELVEVHGHGGPAVVRAVERCALAAGARRARRGEFTERAVASGRLDLLDAEALAALMVADDDGGLAAARGLRASAAPLRSLAARAAAAAGELRGLLDHPLETADARPSWPNAANEVRADIVEWLDNGGGVAEAASLLRDGRRVVLLGPPNAGKSSLLNALVGEGRALVDDLPGTTRDAQAVAVWVGGCRWSIFDTAGLRVAAGVEALGVERALAVAASADLRVWVEDSAAPAAGAASQLAEGLGADVTVWTKADLPRHPSRGDGTSALLVSAKSGAGLEALRAALAAALPPPPRHALTARQRQALNVALEALEQLFPEGWQTAEAGVVALRLEEAARALQTLGGGGEDLDLSKTVYASFCVGK